jgi:hypothetical protein
MSTRDRADVLLEAYARLLARAEQHRDEHVIKFADTAIDSYEGLGNPNALTAAHLIPAWT